MRDLKAFPTRSAVLLPGLLAGLLALSGCITVNAPSEPIVIELNINITQEVIYRLAEDAGNAIDENADIF
ncbi:YnbE family lipoprotein [Altererythrobacter aestuarii]|uniref:YnbE family lipoprotein n=2 Tax=Alteraurantiacibacter aestuarii TaxID=650004 RepID=A0A844ZKA7_9SPHN|nr:YnbE family lipoprotein [Alteraurantiacibacter aestuarii]